MKKSIALLLCLLLLGAMLAGCGAKSEESLTMDSAASTAAGAPVEMPEEEIMYEEAATEEAVAQTTADLGMTATTASAEPETITDIGEKIIYSADLYLETTEFDRALAELDAMVTEVGGYVQQSSVDGSTRYNDDGTTSVVDRYAYYTIAVPSGKFESVLSKTGEIGNVISQQRYAENISSQYTDTEARVESLEVQEERLLAMMKETTDIESLIALEARLAEVTYEIESYQRTLNDWDRRVAYSTLYISLQEVEIYTPTVPVTRTFSERLGDAFSDGWSSFGRSVQGFVLGLAELLPVLILLGVVTAAVLIIVRRARRNKKKRTAPTGETKPENTEETK